jgi:hypothetical protein
MNTQVGQVTMPSWEDVKKQASCLVGPPANTLYFEKDNRVVLTLAGKEFVRRYYNGTITSTMEDAFPEVFSDFSAGLLIDLVSKGELPNIFISIASLYTSDVYNYYHGIGGW